MSSQTLTMGDQHGRGVVTIPDGPLQSHCAARSQASLQLTAGCQTPLKHLRRQSYSAASATVSVPRTDCSADDAAAVGVLEGL